MNSVEQEPSGQLAVDGGVALCAMGMLSLATAVFTGGVVGVSVGTFHVFDLDPVVATVLATWVGGWTGLAAGCGMVWRKNHRAAQTPSRSHTLDECCEIAVARLKRERKNLLASHAVQEGDWTFITTLLRQSVEEQSQAMSS